MAEAHQAVGYEFTVHQNEEDVRLCREIIKTSTCLESLHGKNAPFSLRMEFWQECTQPVPRAGS